MEQKLNMDMEIILRSSLAQMCPSYINPCNQIFCGKILTTLSAYIPDNYAM